MKQHWRRSVWRAQGIFAQLEVFGAAHEACGGPERIQLILDIEAAGTPYARLSCRACNQHAAYRLPLDVNLFRGGVTDGVGVEVAAAVADAMAGEDKR